jgi:hypothetical protein
MNDENEGLGGSYLIDPTTGQRALVARTKPPAPAGEQKDEPASEAGFFSPDQPADPTTTAE